MTTRRPITPATTADGPMSGPPVDSAATVAATAAPAVPLAVATTDPASAATANPASVATATSNPAGMATAATPTMATATGHGHTPSDSASDMSIDTASVTGLAVATGRGQPADTATSTAVRRPVAATAAARVLAEFIVLTSVASLAFGVGRWLAVLTTGTAPAGSGWSAAVGMLAPAGWLDPLVFHVLAQGGQAPSITLEGFLNNVQAVIFGLLATLTTTFLFIGFARWIAAQEPGEYEEAKKALKNAGKGFVGALLSPTIVSVLQTLISGSGRR